ncbi:MAG: glycosyltransferase [Candidatus Nanopelagicales bacterium]|nr:glycosyltransferase [Candidatus Nanopelagicales bacterium]
MRVVEVITGLGLGGAEQGLVNRLHFQPDDVETTVINTRPELDRFSADVREHADALIETAPTAFGRTSLAGLIRDQRPDVVISHLPMESTRLLWTRVPREVPTVIMAESEVMSTRPLRNAMLKALARPVQHRAALHIAISQLAAQGCQCRGAHRIVISPLGAHLPPTEELASPWPAGARLRLLSLNRLIEAKNLVTLVLAVGDEATAMRAAGAHLLIVGDGPEQAAIEAAIGSAGLDDLVTLHPAISPPSAVLREADCLIVSSLFEGGPLTIYEALLVGTRVTSTPVGVAPQTLAGDDGHLVLMHGTGRADLRTGLLRTLAQQPVTPDERAARALAGHVWGSEHRSAEFYDAIRALVQP